MSTPTLDVFDVAQSKVFEEAIKGESAIAEGWWSGFRERKDRKYCLAVGAVPDKVPFVEPELPRLALGKAAQRPISSTFGKTSSMRQFDLEMMSSELHDYLRASGHYTRRPFHRKGESRPAPSVAAVDCGVASLPSDSCRGRPVSQACLPSTVAHCTRHPRMAPTSRLVRIRGSRPVIWVGRMACSPFCALELCQQLCSWVMIVLHITSVRPTQPETRGRTT